MLNKEKYQMLYNYKVGDRVVINRGWGSCFIIGIVEAVNDSYVLVAYIAEKGHAYRTWVTFEQVSLYTPPNFDILGEHHA